MKPKQTETQLKAARNYAARQRKKGLVQFHAWIPEYARPHFHEMVKFYRENKNVRLESEPIRRERPSLLGMLMPGTDTREEIDAGVMELQKERPGYLEEKASHSVLRVAQKISAIPFVVAGKELNIWRILVACQVGKKPSKEEIEKATDYVRGWFLDLSEDLPDLLIETMQETEEHFRKSDH